jgi:hypothetical protein
MLSLLLPSNGETGRRGMTRCRIAAEGLDGQKAILCERSTVGHLANRVCLLAMPTGLLEA